MIEVEPKVFLWKQDNILLDELIKWMQHVHGEAIFEHFTGTDPEKVIELAARNCYFSFDVGLNSNLTQVQKNSDAFHHNYLQHGHGSVMEHSTATFAFEDVSRVFTHEIVRNRAGLAYSQRSLRYIRLDELHFWIPPEIRDAKELTEQGDTAVGIFESVIKHCEWAQRELAIMFDIDNQSKHRKQQLTSAFRRIAPIGLATGIVVTFNMRALRHVIVQRSSPAAEIEMRTVFNEVGHIAKKRWPMLFQDFFEDQPRDSGPAPWISEFVKV